MGRILLLSEDQDQLELYQAIFKHEGYACVIATTPQDAFHYLQTSQINVVFIIGLYHQGFKGLAFYADLKSDPELGQIPVILYNARIMSDLQINPTDYGDTLLSMPVDVRALIDRVRDLIV
ncbi:MAG: hypothetical protein AAF485_02495 [Chloroflexota bacterium]